MSDKAKGNLFVTAQFAILGVLVLLQGTFADWRLPSWSLTVTYALLFVGFGTALNAVFGLGRAISANPVPSAKAKLVTHGAFASVRHPIYSGIMLGSVSLAATTGTWLGVIATVGLIVLLNFKARFEEKLLLAKFDDYREYASRVGRFVPGIGKLK